MASLEARRLQHKAASADTAAATSEPSTGPSLRRARRSAPEQHRYVNAAALAAPMPLDTEEINPRCEVPSPFSAAAITAPAPPAPPSVLGKRPAVADIHSSSSPELGKGSKVVEDVAKKPKKNDRLTQMHITIKPATLPLPADVIENNTPAATTTVTTAVPSSNPHDTGGSSSSSTASNVSTTDADPFPRPVMISTAGRWRHQFHNQLMGRPQDLQGPDILVSS
ncbi:hypothetical protein WJX73_003357 [Symbiochloris irregularis]|uniref:Uncharacterized protein n=1 Tax=Symbiochloris irregularis TaxID=706552 RepID=A0AAW1NUL3_9CHLO